MRLEDIILNEIIYSKECKCFMVSPPSYEGPKVVKFTKAESSSFQRLGGGENGKLLLGGYKVIVLQDEEISGY
jgi:hypothetical protein